MKLKENEIIPNSEFFIMSIQSASRKICLGGVRKRRRRKERKERERNATKLSRGII